MEKFVTQLVAISNKIGWKYKLKGETVAPENVFSPKGLLPGIVRRANQVSMLCTGSTINGEIKAEKESTLGKVVTFPEDEISIEGILYIIDQIYEMGRVGDGVTISLDDLMYD
mgnify:CR=1 FL=1|tara:strand:- start:1175 stop:1513 length:339 start_codon:yes stop_codon:yes gene_type:complete